MKAGRLEMVGAASITDFMPTCSIYSFATALLGFIPCRHEGKLTGLAAGTIASPQCIEALVSLSNKFTPLDGTDAGLFAWKDDTCLPADSPHIVVNHHLRSLLRAQLSAFSDREIAAAAQSVITTELLLLLHRLEQVAGTGDLILSGGLFANVRLNLSIAEAWSHGRVFVCPPMGDEGLAVGAAALAYQETHSRLPNQPEDLFLGPHLRLGGLDGGKRQVRYVSDAPAMIASALADGHAVAVARGRSEFGPRALGHRSILAPALSKNAATELNVRLGRNDFMPFAPMIRAEDASRLLAGPLNRIYESMRNMTICAYSTRELEELCPSVVHLDGTCRPQIVDVRREPFLHSVLTNYVAITGLPALINTSFNIHEEPIVDGLSSILRSFDRGVSDLLFLGDEAMVARN